MDSSMANMGQGQVQQTTSGATMDNMAKGNERGSNAVLQKATGIQRHRKTSTKVKISLSYSELHAIEYAIKDFYNIEINEKGKYGELLRKIRDSAEKALEREIEAGKWL